MANLIGTWDLESSENFDEFMKELGVSFLLRKTAATLKPTSIISKNADTGKWSFQMKSTFKNSETIFEDGVTFDEETLDGRKSKTTIRVENENKMIQEQRDPKTDEVVTTIVRELIDGKLLQTMTAKNVVAKRIFKKSA